MWWTEGDTWNWRDCDCDCDCVLGGCGVLVFVVICSPLYELVGFGDGVVVLGSCDHGLLFMFDCDFLGCICFDTCFVVKRVL